MNLSVFSVSRVDMMSEAANVVMYLRKRGSVRDRQRYWRGVAQSAAAAVTHPNSTPGMNVSMLMGSRRPKTGSSICK